ncbi:hypothetical protein H5410_062696 [Solanum commersonii]|uniref:MADS-box domain-containing protein n=1 Tax=Solanum commersonii TaxID=4109 RepID=A0A9J5WBJ1_SOLCO|nr:hypothetical protein H5410_062696 [Solanum commersonii]
MRKIENKNALFTIFFKTTSELVTKFDVDIGIIVFSPTSKPRSFFYPTIDAILSDDTHLALIFARNSVNQLNFFLKNLTSKKKLKLLEQIILTK